MSASLTAQQRMNPYILTMPQWSQLTLTYKNLVASFNKYSHMCLLFLERKECILSWEYISP